MVDDCKLFKDVDYAKSLPSRNEIIHAAHGLIYARHTNSFESQPQRANVLMVSRFDGKLGFPGGIVDKEDSTIVDALNRECVEEIALNIDKISFQQKDHVVSRMCTDNKLFAHFYALEVTEAQYNNIEGNIRNAKDWGTETLGYLRVPLYRLPGGQRGLPSFLSNQFSGDARGQLLTALHQRAIITEQEFTLHMAT